MFKEKLAALINAMTKSNSEYATDDIKSVEQCISMSQRYVDSVVTMERTIRVQRFRMEAEEYRLAVEEIDGLRRKNHDAMMAQYNLTNRLCALYGVEEVFPVGDRKDAAQAAMTIVTEYFQSGQAA